MSLLREKIEHFMDFNKSKSRKWRKNQFNRYIRRYNKLEIPIMKCKKGWEW